MPVAIRPPDRADAAALAALLEEMEAHYGIEVPPGRALAAADRLCAALPEPPCLVAHQAGRIIGVALFGVLFPGAALTDVIYLKDLYVTPAARGAGAGSALLRAVAAVAVARGATRMEWTTGRDNRHARSLYGALGAVTRDKLVLQVDGVDALTRFAEGRLDPVPETGDGCAATSREG